ncbi:MAG: hypothetical protein ABIS21_01710, partial [Acidimicrobiales bacterium]
MALLPVAALVLAAAFTGDANVVYRNPLRYAAWVTVVAALVHPAGRAFFHSFGVSRSSGRMLALVGIAAVPLLAFASTNIRLQRKASADLHVLMGHYGFMAAFAFTIITVGLLASLRPVGWRLTAWVAGLLPALLGVTSLLYPDTASSLDQLWAIAAITWGAIFIAAAALTNDARSDLNSDAPTSTEPA